MKDSQWDVVIGPKNSVFSLNLKEVWRYKDLLFMTVKRDFVTLYKQTILGPLWFFIQPIFTTIVYTFVFGNLAGISTDGLPKILFYLSGTICWNYFAECFTKTSTVFKDNQAIFGKVYFPRLISPLSIVITGLMKLFVQLLLFLTALCCYNLFTEVHTTIEWTVVLFPVLIVIMALLSLGMGMIITSMTTKYRDLVFLLQFGIQLLMYATPVIYPLSAMPEKYKWLLVLNPMTAIIETFRTSFLGSGSFQWSYLVYSFGVSTIIFLIGTVVFNRTEKDFMDTV